MFVFPHISNLVVRNEFTELFLAHAQDIVGIIFINFIFSRSCFRSEVSLSIIVKCNVNRGAK